MPKIEKYRLCSNPMLSTCGTINNSLIEQDITVIRIARILLSGPEERLHGRFVNHLYILVVEEEPVVVALNKADIVTVVGPTTDVDHHSKQGVLGVSVLHCVDQLQLEGEHHPV